MTSDISRRPISPLRARMVEDMTVRGFNERTRSHYVRHVRAFAAFIGRSPDTATAEDLRLFQLHQTQIGVQPQLAALKRLDDQTRRLEGRVTSPAFAQVLDQERRDSHANGGRSV